MIRKADITIQTSSMMNIRDLGWVLSFSLKKFSQELSSGNAGFIPAESSL